MSEEVSYQTSVSADGSSQGLQRTLRRHGLFSIDRAAWADAHERVRQLHQAVTEELGRCHAPGPQTTAIPAAMLAALNRVPIFHAVAEKHHAVDVKALRDDIEKLQTEASRLPDTAALSAQSKALQQRVEALGTRLQTRLCRIEGEVVLQAATVGLQRLGYAVETRGDRLRATKAQSCVWAEESTAGQLTMDFSGFSGLTCLKARQSIEAELAKEGVRLARCTSITHGRPEGGVLAGRLRPLFWDFQTVATQHEPVISLIRPLNGIRERR